MVGTHVGTFNWHVFMLFFFLHIEVDDFWPAAVKMISDMGFLQSLPLGSIGLEVWSGSNLCYMVISYIIIIIYIILRANTLIRPHPFYTLPLGWLYMQLGR